MKSYTKLSTLFKRSVSGKVSTWFVEVEDNKFRTISGFEDGKKITSEWTECFSKNIGKKNGTTPEQQAMFEAEALHRKKIELGFFEDINKIDTPVFFKPMLANKWEDRKDKITFPVYSQPKLDGIRCIVKSDGMWSRNGKKIISAPHIYESLKPLLEINPDLVFDGELYADKFAHDFNAICSLVKKTKPTESDLQESAEKIEYHIYDLPSSDKGFSDRYVDLVELSKSSLFPYCCKLVMCHVCSDENIINSWYEDYIVWGYEGQMLRTDGLYENKRSNSLLKNKSFEDAEFTILEVHEGKGKLSGKVGYMVFKTNEGHEFASTVNGTQEYLEELLKQKDKLVGKQATIKYFNLTPGTSIPRFPKVVAIRDYE